MPKIPIQQQPQILNASSPVPIAGTGEARMEGEAISQFGRGLASFADAKERANQLAAQVQMEEADAAFDTIRRDRFDKAVGEINKNPGQNGMDARKKFVDGFKEDLDALGSNISNPLYRRLWSAKTKQRLNAFGEDIGTAQLKNQVQEISKGIDSTTTLYAQMAIDDPLRRDEAVIKAKALIENVGEDVYSPVMKQQKLGLVESKIDTAIIEGLKEKGRSSKMEGYYDVARKHLELYSKSFAPEEVDKIRDGIEKDKLAMQKDAAWFESQEAKRLKIQQEKIQRVNGPLVMSKLMKANSPTERERIMDQALKMVSEGILDRSHYSLLQTWGSRADKELSAELESAIRKKIYDGAPKHKIMQETVELAAKDRLTDEAKIRIISRLERRDSTSPEDKKLLRSYVNSVKRPHQYNPYDPRMRAKERNMMDLNQDRAERIFWSQYERSGDMAQAARETHKIMQTEAFGVQFEKGGKTSYADPAARAREKERILKAYTTHLGAGNKEAAKRLMEELNVIETFDKTDVEKRKLDDDTKSGQPKERRPPSFWEQAFESAKGLLWGGE